MADVLAQTSELNTLLGESVDPGTATLLIELATGAVQAAIGQRLVHVAGGVVDELIGSTDRWLTLPERPVTAVAEVTIDGETITDYKKFGSRLWRKAGWASSPYTPAEVAVTCDHGYQDGDQKLQPAKNVALMLAAQSYENPTSTTGMSIDDYREQRAQVTDALLNQIPDATRRSLRRTYGRTAGLARIG